MLRHCIHKQHSYSHQQSVAAAAAAAAPATMAATSPAFSLFFPLLNTKAFQFDDDSHSSVTTCPSSPSSSSSTGSVDCTLSLGTPSSRRAAAKPRSPCLALPSRSAVSCDVAAPADQSCCCRCCSCPGGSQPSPAAANKRTAAVHGHGQDPAPLVDHRCASCGTTSTPLWRNGPRGPKSLCNACGIRFKKKERRAASATADMDQGGCYLAQRAQYGAAASGRAYYGGGDGDIADAEAVPAQFLAWRPSVVEAVWPEPATLFQYIN